MGKSIFDTLTPEDKEYLAHIYYDGGISHKKKMELLSKKYDVAPRTIRGWWKDKLNLSERHSKVPKQLLNAYNFKIHKDTKVLLVTGAQNKSSINLDGLDNMKAYANLLTEYGLKTQIVVMPSRYRNPTSQIENEKLIREEWWRDEVLDYLCYGKFTFGDTLLSANSRIRPTAKEPFSGYELLASDKHLILPHPKVHFKTLPRFKNDPLRTMLTTGFITHENYSDSKSGEIAHENHSFGFVVVELKEKNKCFIPRNVKMSSDGSFYDLCFSVKNGKVNRVKNVEGFVWGDIHSRVIDETIFGRTLGLVNVLKPKKQVLHDVFDGSTVSPHETKDMFIQRQKILKNQYLIEDEVEESFDIISKIKENISDSEIYITLSNHDVFIDRFINNENWKKDLHNSATYLKYAYIQQTVNLEEYGNIYGYLLSNAFSDVHYVKFGESLKIGAYECGSHGDYGANGAKGSYKTFSRLNTKMIHGHTHSPVIHNGVTVVGVTCLLHQYYNKRGISSWAHAHSIIHNKNKNQLVVFDDDNEISNIISFTNEENSKDK